MGSAIDRALLLLSALAGLGAVALGAFGAHAMGDQLGAKQTEWWETASFYLLTHAAVGTAISIASGTQRLVTAGLALVIGALIFAATLYAMALGAPTWLGAVTPIGGIAMIAGWAMLLISALRSR